MRVHTSSLVAVLAAAVLGVGLTVPAAGAPPAAASECRRTLPAYPELMPHDRGPAVRTLQCVLNDAGLGPVTVDGVYGPQTKAAVKELVGTFEGLPAHLYVIKPFYWTVLFTRSHRLHGLEPGDSGIRVRTLQRALRALGETLVVDGDFGPQTRARVVDFQASCDIERSGRIDDRTIFFLAMGGCSG